MSASNVIELYDFSHNVAPVRSFDDFQIAAGCHIFPPRPRQSAKTPEKLLDRAARAESDFVHEMELTARNLGLALDYPGIKSHERLVQKAHSDYKGQADEVLDPLRASLICNSNADIQNATNYFLPAHNSRVAALLNQFQYPDPENRLRRAKVTYYLPDHDIFTEVQIKSSALSPVLDKTHLLYEEERDLKHHLMSSVSPLPLITQRMEQIALERRALHDLFAEKSGMTKNEIVYQAFGEAHVDLPHRRGVQSVPFAALETGNGDIQLVRPDASGFYTIDNGLYSYFSSGRYTETPRNDFVAASLAIAAPAREKLFSRQGSVVGGSRFEIT